MFRKKRTACLFLALSIVLISCSDLIVSTDRDNRWVVADSANVVLHYRPQNFSGSASPTQDQANYILRAQNIYYAAIQDSINREYNDKVLIYLYNFDEAIDKIGTNGGGHALPKFNTYYYAFIDSNKSITDHFGVVDPYVGAHELVHVITHRTLGYPKTKLMSEGYAVWLDGTFARFYIEDIIRHYRDDQPEKVLTPDQLLLDANAHASSVYYPNAGLFVKYLVRQFGVETLNTLFTSSENDFVSRLETLTAESWEDICSNYASHLNDL